MKRILIITVLFYLIGGPMALYAGTISGTVEDESTGEPLEYVKITLYHFQCNYPSSTTSNCTWEPLANLYTNTNGAFTSPELTAGEYQLKIESANYLTEYFDNISEINRLNGMTTITISEEEELELETIYLAKRPFHFGEVRIEPSDLFLTGGRGVIIAEVENNSGSKKRMLFWSIFNVTRTDDSEYYGLDSFFPGSKPGKFKLHPGTNEIEIPIFVPEKYADGTSIDFSLYGGNSTWQPRIPPYRKWILVGRVTRPILRIPEPPQLSPNPIVINPIIPQPAPNPIIINPVLPRPLPRPIPLREAN